jgi:predicted ATPase/DNA-binding SARP family transcriptional activator
VFEIRLLGRFSVIADGVPVGDDRWRHRDAASLVKFLSLRERRSLHREQVFDALWPDLALPAAANRLHKAAHHARRATGHPGTVTLRRELVALFPDHEVAVDVEHFEHLARQALSRGEPEPARRALEVYRGQLLPEDPYAPWSTLARDRLQQRYLELLRLAGRWDEVIAADPTDEAAHLALVRLLASQGHRRDAIRQLDRMAVVLERELGVAPGPEATELRHQLTAVDVGVHPAPVDAAPASWTAGADRQARVLPFAGSSFVGREELMTRVEDLLAAHRLVTLVGTAGVGKTRLASEVGRRWSEAEELWFCELGGTDRTGVAATVAATLGIEPRADEDLTRRIADVLRAQRALIVLDNCEHVLYPAAALAEAVLGRAAGVRILATSRERLAVRGEQLCPVEPLPLPDGADAGAPAVRLFVDRSRSVRIGFDIDDQNSEILAEICRRLDGLPLAIELAAARLQALEPGEVLAGLDERFELLVGGQRTSPRHRSLAAALAWSYDLLEPEEQELLERLSVFAGPVSTAAAAAVTGGSLRVVRPRLARLVERSLAHRVDGGFGLLETVRQYGGERLRDRGCGASAQNEHARFFLEFSEDACRRMTTDRTGEVLGELDRQLVDLRVAFSHLCRTQEADAALRMVIALRSFGFNRMRPEVLEWGEQAARIEGGASHPLTPDALANAAMGAWKRGDLDGFHRLVARAANAADEVKHHRSTDVEYAVGLQALVGGQLSEAQASWSDSLARPAPRDILRWAEVATSELICRSYLHRAGTSDDADQLVARLPDGIGIVPESWCWYAAGEAVLDADPSTARSRLDTALALSRRAKADFVTGIAGASAASLEVRHGDPARAVELYRWLLPLWRRAGVQTPLWTMLRSIARLLANLGHPEQASLVLGAASAPLHGHEVAGDDAARLGRLSEELERGLGRVAFEAQVAVGASLGADAAASLAASTLEAHGGG